MSGHGYIDVMPEVEGLFRKHLPADYRIVREATPPHPSFKRFVVESDLLDGGPHQLVMQVSMLHDEPQAVVTKLDKV